MLYFELVLCVNIYASDGVFETDGILLISTTKKNAHTQIIIIWYFATYQTT